jgi:hypothetical protein
MAEKVKQETLGQFRVAAMYSEPGEALHFAQGRFLDELPGIAFAAITLIWIVSSFAGLQWRELPAEVTAYVGAITHFVGASHTFTMVRRLGSTAGVAARIYGYLAARNTA